MSILCISSDTYIMHTLALRPLQNSAAEHSSYYYVQQGNDIGQGLNFDVLQI